MNNLEYKILLLKKEKRKHELRIKEINKELEQLVAIPFKEIKIGESFIYNGSSFTKITKTKSIINSIVKGVSYSFFDNVNNVYNKSHIKNYLHGKYLELMRIDRNHITDIDLISAEEFLKLDKYIRKTEDWWWLKNNFNGLSSCGVSVVTAESPIIQGRSIVEMGAIRPSIIFKPEVKVQKEEGDINEQK